MTANEILDGLVGYVPTPVDSEPAARVALIASALNEKVGRESWQSRYCGLGDSAYACELTICAVTRSAAAFISDSESKRTFFDALFLDAARGFKIETTIDEHTCAESDVTELVDAAQDVVSNWESGDLAGAVNRLDAALQSFEPVEEAPTITAINENGQASPAQEPEQVAAAEEPAHETPATEVAGTPVEEMSAEVQVLPAAPPETAVANDIFADAAVETREVFPAGYTRGVPTASLFTGTDATLQQESSVPIAAQEGSGPAKCARCGLVVMADQAEKCRGVGIDPIHPGCAT